MEAIRLYLKVDSDTLHIPELRRFIGKRVELILIEEEPSEEIKKMEKFFSAVGKVNIDEEAVHRLREESKL